MDIQCCVCGLVKSGQGWRRVREILRDVSHTYCPRCAAAALAALGPPEPTQKASGTRRARPGKSPDGTTDSRFYTAAASDSAF